MNKKIIVSLSAISLFIIPVSAKAFVIPNPLDGILTQLNSQINTLSQRLEITKNEKLVTWSDSIGSDLQAAVDEAIGALGLPDILAVREGIKQDTDTGGLYSETTAANAVDRAVTRINASATLSQQGQDQSLHRLQQTETAVALAQRASDVAQGEVATQNVMKRIAQQNELNAALLGSIASEQIQQAQRDELANTNLSNISEAIDGQNQQRNAEVMGAAMDFSRTSSFTGLF